MFKIDIESNSDATINPSLKEVTEDKDAAREVKDNEVVTRESEQDIKDSDNQYDASDILENTINEKEKSVKTVPPEKDRYWSKLKKEREEKVQLTEQLEQLHQEKVQMEQMLAQAINAGSAQYKNNVASELEMAQARLQLSLESGDAASVARATADISKATHALNEAAKIGNFPETQYSEDYTNVAKAREYESRLYDWLESNPEVDKNTPQYDEQLAGQVLSFIRKLDRKYQTINKEHLIGSGSYYSMIDEYIDNLKMYDTSPERTPAKHFGAVRSRSPMESIPNPKTRELSDREKKAALAFGMSYERYRELLDKHNKEMRSKNGN